MSAKDIRKLLENFDQILNEEPPAWTAEAQYHRAIDLIHQVFAELNGTKEFNPMSLKKIVDDLIETVQSIISCNVRDHDITKAQKNPQLQSLKNTLSSISTQLSDNKKAKESFIHIKASLMTFLKKLYEEVILLDTNFEELAKNNVEAKDKITKLAKLLYFKAPDQESRTRSNLIIKQASKIS